MSSTTKESTSRPERHGEDWRVGEVALLYLVEKSDEAKKKLAALLDRTEDAVDFAWRWCDEANFPEVAETGSKSMSRKCGKSSAKRSER